MQIWKKNLDILFMDAKNRKFGELYQLPKFHAKLENMP